MGFYRGPNIVTDGLTFAVDAGMKDVTQVVEQQRIA